MIRQPTPVSDQLTWHRAAIAGEMPDRFENEPQPGWYKRRMVRQGPFIPVRIWLHQVTDEETGELCEPETLRAEMLGQSTDPYATWTFCTPISREEYLALIDLHRDEELIMAATHAAVDLAKTPISPRSNRQ